MNCIEKRAEVLIKSVEFSWMEFPKRRPVAASESKKEREETILNRRFGKTAVAAMVAREAKPDDVVVVMSSGAFDGVHEKILQRLGEQG